MKRERGTGAYKKRGGSTWGGKAKRERKEKPCPAFKKINGTNIIVDGFQYKSYSVSSYFLTHFHSDHYTGITKGFDFGIIYCSEITAKLMFIKLGVSPNYVRPLSMFTPHVVEGTEVTLLPANHCPGAVLLLFKVDGRYILHVGDFRYHPNMQSYDELRRNEIHTIYLDTTYCAPQHCFPPREETVERVVELVLREKRAVRIRINALYPSTKRYVLLQCMDIPDFDDIITTDSTSTNLHVVPMNCLSFQKMGLLMSKMKARYSRIIGIRPTGWAGDVKHTTKRNLELYEVPYSEHSNYYELREFVEFLRPSCIVPTVNCWSQAKVEAQLYHFRDLVKGSTAPPPDFGAAARGKAAITSHFERKGTTTSTSSSASPYTPVTTSRTRPASTLFQAPQRASSSPSFLTSTITSYFGFTDQRKAAASAKTASTSVSSPAPAFSASPAFFSFFSRSRSDSSIKRDPVPEHEVKVETKAAWDIDDDDQFLYEAALLLDDSQAELMIKDESKREGDEEVEEDDAEDEQQAYSPLAFSEGEDEDDAEAAYAGEVGILELPGALDQSEEALVAPTFPDTEEEEQDATHSQEAAAPPPSNPSTPLRGHSLAATPDSPPLAHERELLQDTAVASSPPRLADEINPSSAAKGVASLLPPSPSPCVRPASSPPMPPSPLTTPQSPFFAFAASPSPGRLSLKRKREAASSSSCCTQPSPSQPSQQTTASGRVASLASPSQPVFIDLTDDEEPAAGVPAVPDKANTGGGGTSSPGPLAAFVTHGRLGRAKSDPALRGRHGSSTPSPTQGAAAGQKRRKLSGGAGGKPKDDSPCPSKSTAPSSVGSAALSILDFLRRK